LAAIFMVREQVSDHANIQKIHKDTLPELRQAVSQAIPFLSKANAKNLVHEWKQYRNTPEELLKNDENAKREQAFGELRKVDINTGREVITKMLDYLESAINEA